jgi:hypothetical protein
MAPTTEVHTMPGLTFFPLGNADCCLIRLADGRRVLFDYANTRDPNDKEDLRCDLPGELRDDLDEAERDSYAVVAFTHLDKDHYEGASEFFWLRHATKYQGKDRIKIDMMWVPAAVITEENLDEDEAKIIQAEARYRFKQKHGIRVFSRPERLRKWCDRNRISLEDRLALITDAGRVAEDFAKERDGVEFFVHCPFAKRLNASTVEDRNDDALVMQATFVVNQVETKVLLMADVTHDIIADIVDVTKRKDRETRLEWDVVKIPHHCSYRALGPEKGEDKTKPVEQVAWLYETQQQDNATIVSSSKPVPEKGSEEDEDHNPPHRQAADYYKGVVEEPEDQFKVTMQHPKASAPKPLVIHIDACKAIVEARAVGTAAVAITSRPPRAG